MWCRKRIPLSVFTAIVLLKQRLLVLDGFLADVWRVADHQIKFGRQRIHPFRIKERRSAVLIEWVLGRHFAGVILGHATIRFQQFTQFIANSGYKPISGTLAETYLREARGITYPLPEALRFHPASLFFCRGEHLAQCGPELMGWMAPASTGVAMRHTAVVLNCL